jgi:hypothetical protein
MAPDTHLMLAASNGGMILFPCPSYLADHSRFPLAFQAVPSLILMVGMLCKSPLTHQEIQCQL